MIPVAPYLLIDNSNSRTKMALASREKLGEKRVLPTQELTRDTLAEITCDWAPERVILSSVVPETAKIIVDGFQDRILCVTHETDLGVLIDFPEPSTIGADRLANAAAVAELYDTPAVVVDFGTAVTFDVISADKAYIGGIIAPGLEVMTDYLYQRTALLPRIQITEPTEVIGKSTENAMLSGAVHGYRGLIKEILRQVQSETGGSLLVIATGGYADLIAAHLPAIQILHPDLTLDGLRIIANRCSN